MNGDPARSVIPSTMKMPTRMRTRDKSTPADISHTKRYLTLNEAENIIKLSIVSILYVKACGLVGGFQSFGEIWRSEDRGDMLLRNVGIIIGPQGVTMQKTIDIFTPAKTANLQNTLSATSTETSNSTVLVQNHLCKYNFTTACKQ
jgi:hypothetical protein